MSYPPPPGLGASKAASSSSSATSTQHAPASLPPRPPPPAGAPLTFAPTFSSAPSVASGAPGTTAYAGGPASAAPPSATVTGGFTAFRPRQVAGAGAAPSWSSHAASASGPSASYAAPATYGGVVTQQPPYQASHAQQYYPSTAQGPYQSTSPPQIRNPFPLPGQEHHAGVGRGRGSGRYQDPSVDPEMEAQIAQWQSAYVSKDAADQSNNRAGRPNARFGGQGTEGPASASGANAGPLGGKADASGSTTVSGPAVASSADTDSSAAAAGKGADGKQKTVQRSGGGQSWTDPTLLEWDPAHFRLFVGNLAGEVTDDSLLKAFSRYPSVQKARVVRDKRTTKSKGYGFVSFSDGDEYFQAAKEMQGKYIGSHPVLLRRSTTEIRPVVHGDKKGGKAGKGGKNAALGAAAGAKTGAGVQKKSTKTKGGLRVLG